MRLESRQSACQLGYSLVEMMVAVLLSVFIVGVSFSLLVSSSKTFGEHQSESALQENAHYAINLLKRAIRNSGISRDLNLDINVDSAQTSVAAVYFDSRCSRQVNASPRLVNTFPCSASNLSRFGDRLALLHDGDEQTCPRQTELIWPAILVSLFWAADMDQDGITSLYCRTLNPESGEFLTPAVPLVDGIGHLTFKLGLDLNTDEVIDSYQALDSIPSNTESVVNGALQNLEIKGVRIRVAVSAGLAPLGQTTPQRHYSTTEGIRSASL